MGLCGSSPQSRDGINKIESQAHFNVLKMKSQASSIRKDEFYTYIDEHAELWAMLGVNLGLDDKKCKLVAVDVAFNMVVKKHIRDESLRRRSYTDQGMLTMDHEQFFKFQEIVSSPQGQLEFFHRTVFQAFDQDNNGLLDADELDAFLETFYSADSIFKGDARLPTKEILKKIVKEKFDADGDGELSFDEIHCIISGKADLTEVVTVTTTELVDSSLGTKNMEPPRTVAAVDVQPEGVLDTTTTTTITAAAEED